MSQVGFIRRVGGGLLVLNESKSSRNINRVFSFPPSSYVGFIVVSLVLSSFYITGANSEESNTNSNDIQSKMRDFLNSHCNKQNQSLEQEEYETFIKCNPTQAAMIIRNIDTHKEAEADVRHGMIQQEINRQCSEWPSKRSCQKRNFKLIEKCFDGQQKFVFYFLLALTDTICQDGDLFIEFWEKGGDKCMNQHLMQLTKEISQCFIFTSTMTKEELDRNIDKITNCIGEKFQNCGSPESNKVIQNLLRDIESFYNEIQISSASSSASSSLFIATTTLPNIIITLSIIAAISQERRAVNALFSSS